MAKKKYLNVQGLHIALMKRNHEDFISLTDMARYKDNDPFLVIAHWMRIKNTIEYLGAWEILHNSGFNPTEFGRLLNEAGSNRFMLTPQKWMVSTNAIGIISKAGKNGGTYAHKDIAYNFGMWLNPVFQLYITEDYLRLMIILYFCKNFLMKHIQYTTQGTCSILIDVTADDDNVIQNVAFLGGCNGNLQGICRLVKGQKIDDVIAKLDGIRCGNKITSCPDQLCQALKELKRQ